MYSAYNSSGNWNSLVPLLPFMRMYLPHGLAAVPGGTGQLVFAGQPLPAGVNAILNFGAQPVGQLCIFVFAQKIPPSRNCCVAIVFLIVSYNLCFAMPLTKK